jgi:hypothetical protein
MWMQQFISLTLLLLAITNTSIKSMPSSSPPQEKPLLNTYNLRQYRPSDLMQVKTLFRANIEEEWGVRHHDGRYIDNAKRYIHSVVSDPDSDLNNIDETYFQKGTGSGVGGFFWVLTYSISTGDEGDDDAKKIPRRQI